MMPEKVAESVSREIERICKKHKCEIGVWLSWRDLLHNFDAMKADPNLNELHFGLQIRIHGTNDKDKASDKSAT